MKAGRVGGTERGPDPMERLRRGLSDRYRLERELGGGAMATVYLAEDLRHHRPVAVKVLRPGLAAAIGPERFLREIEIAASLTHPHILPVHDSGRIGETFYYVMPYVEGRSLRDRLERERRLPLEEALQIVHQVAGALDYAHRRGVVHRDIKPANILLSENNALVADFGIARAASTAALDRLTGPGLGVGTPAYMSPEQASGGPIDGRSDIYSLGRMLYEMLVGELAAAPTERSDVAGRRLSRVPASHQRHLAAVPAAVVGALSRALALDPDDRFATGAEFAASLGGFVVPARTHRRALRNGLVAAVGVVVLGLFLFTRTARPTLDPDVVAVAPFDVLGPDLALWREGMADLLSATLDGAGRLRTVPPSVVLKRWEGHADPVYAGSLGRRVGARLVVYGRLIGSGVDSVRAVGALFDVGRGRAIAEFDLRDRSDRIDRLAASLAIRIMDELGRGRGLSGWRLASIGSTSPLAIKAFLRGEQFYRRFSLDSAERYFAQALELDSTFALAYSRRVNAAGWSLNADPGATSALLRAGALNHGLGQRESLLVAADSIRGALAVGVGDSAGQVLIHRLLATLERATLQYPSDPISWQELGEARYHQGAYAGVTDQQARQAFARAVALDSTFVPPFRHLLELTLLVQGREAARQVAQRYVARIGSGIYRDAARVTAALLDSSRAGGAETRAALAALPREGLFQVWYDFKWWPDSAETSVRVARAWVESSDSAGGLAALALALAYRGHLREAGALAGARLPGLFVVLANLGGVAPDRAEATIAEWLREGNLTAIQHAHRWWADQGDTASLKRAVGLWDSAMTAVGPATRARIDQRRRSSRAYLALARGDTLRALALFEGIRNSVNRAYLSYYEQLTRARILSRLGRDREAVDLLDHMPFERQWAPSAEAVLVDLERGRAHERLGDRDGAIGAYSAVLDAWRKADPELQPLVAEARAAIGRLSREPRW